MSREYVVRPPLFNVLGRRNVALPIKRQNLTQIDTWIEFLLKWEHLELKIPGGNIQRPVDKTYLLWRKLGSVKKSSEWWHLFTVVLVNDSDSCSIYSNSKCYAGLDYATVDVIPMNSQPYSFRASATCEDFWDKTALIIHKKPQFWIKQRCLQVSDPLGQVCSNARAAQEIFCVWLNYCGGSSPPGNLPEYIFYAKIFYFR